MHENKTILLLFSLNRTCSRAEIRITRVFSPQWEGSPHRRLPEEIISVTVVSFALLN